MRNDSLLPEKSLALALTAYSSEEDTPPYSSFQKAHFMPSFFQRAYFPLKYVSLQAEGDPLPRVLRAWGKVIFSAEHICMLRMHSLKRLSRLFRSTAPTHTRTACDIT